MLRERINKYNNQVAKTLQSDFKCLFVVEILDQIGKIHTNFIKHQLLKMNVKLKTVENEMENEMEN